MPFRAATIAGSDQPEFTIDAPTALPGDRLICMQTATSSTGEPSGGWAQLAYFGTAGLETRVSIRTATAADPDTYTLTQEPGSTSTAIVASVSGVSPATPRVGWEVGFGTDIVTPGVDLPGGTGTELRFATRTGAGFPVWTLPPGFTPRAQAGEGSVRAVLATRAITVAGATGEKTFQVDEPSILTGATVLFVDLSSGDGGGTTPPPTVPALPSGERIVHYTYAFADLLTDAPICKDLDLRDVTYERRISEPGSFSASVDIADPVTAAKVARIVPRYPEVLSTGPGRTVCHVYRNGVIWGSFIIWTASVSRSARGAITVSLNGASLESYLSRVKIREDLTYPGWDQIGILRDLIDRMQSTPRYNIGLQVRPGDSGMSRDRTYLASETSTYGERIAELGAVADGFEWAIQVVDNGDGTRTRVLTWGYPKLGISATSHKFQEPGGVLSWQEDIDSGRGGTAFWTRGDAVNEDASTSSEPLLSETVLAQAHIDAGWPGLDVTADYSGVSEIGTLNAYAQWWATNRAGTVRVHQATVRLAPNTAFGPGNLGDSVTLMLANDWWPITGGVASFARTWRVVGMAFKPPSKGAGQEECTLTFEELLED